jgi:glutamate synthase (NADPH/NADH) small chain
MQDHNSIPREDLQKESVKMRLSHFLEFYIPATEDQLRKQSSRCMDCGVPLCQSNTKSNNGCPVQNLIPDWNELVRKGEWRRALDLLHSTNNFPEFTGKLCPAPCESVCILGINDQSVSIRNIESSIIEKGFQEGWVQPQISTKKTGIKIAIVGSGPAGLSTAQQLTRLGHSVTVFEKADQIGGLLRYGIPDFKLEKKYLDRRIAQMREEGIEFKTNVEIGKDFSYEDLKNSFTLIGLAIGAEKARDLTVKGRHLKGIHFAMDYLSAQNKKMQSSTGPLEVDALDARGKTVVILGGGDTGADCLGTALRQSCKKAYQIEILPKPNNDRKASHSAEENKVMGGEQLWATSTVEFISNEHGSVKALRTTEVELKDGQFQPVPHTERIIEADLILLAMGFVGPNHKCLESFPLQYTNRGNVLANDNLETSLKGVFVAGDAKRGASLIVWAISEGRKMAESMNRFLINNNIVRN